MTGIYILFYQRFVKKSGITAEVKAEKHLTCELVFLLATETICIFAQLTANNFSVKIRQHVNFVIAV